MNADPEHDADFYEFDLKTVTEYRKKMLSAPVNVGKAVLEELTGQRKEEAEDDDLDWEEEVLGEMAPAPQAVYQTGLAVSPRILSLEVRQIRQTRSASQW